MIRSLALSLILCGPAALAKSYKADGPHELKGVLKVQIKKLKDKGKGFDVEMKVTNLRDETIVTNFRDVNCSRGGVRGEVRFAHFGIGERSLDIGRNQTKNVRYVCRFEPKQKTGEIEISFGPIYDNPSGDGATGGKQLAKEFTIRVPG